MNASSHAPGVDIRRIDAAATRPLRQRILRPHQPAEALVYPGDDAPDSLHVGAFLEGRLVGVASLFHQSPEGGPALPGDWRLRGMATDPDVRRRGIGAALLARCERHAREHGGERLWFHARETAKPFYRASGYRVVGAPYDLPHIGPHVFMERSLAGADPGP